MNNFADYAVVLASAMAGLETHISGTRAKQQPRACDRYEKRK